MDRKNYIMAVACLCVLSLGTAHAGRSVFIISNHIASEVQAYSINGTQVDLQETVGINNHDGLGPPFSAPKRRLRIMTGAIVASSERCGIPTPLRVFSQVALYAKIDGESTTVSSAGKCASWRVTRPESSWISGH
ncbi:MAG: hypothetical protein JSU70_17740 [Phycisphaerales bacterium]|nr:MAG: hypothetical protein JSU70_17740 [Phycisphaerales bacterium]